MQPHLYGIHRVIEPVGKLPQPAWKVDATPVCYDNEMLIDVDRLNIDSASFRQLKEEVGNEPEAMKRKVLSIIAERGKMHNPVTGSGGMLIGRVKETGPEFPSPPVSGEKIATLVSLSLTPLHITDIKDIDMKTGQIAVEGTAVLFASGLYAILPETLPEALSLAVLDVCGAPAQTAAYVQPHQYVFVMGAGGKSGMLSLIEARRKLGKTGKLIALEYGSDACDRLRAYGLADAVVQMDATDTVAVYETVKELTDGMMADLTINCVNVPHTEMSSILSTRDGGTVYFFSMATSFTAAALGAEGVGKDVTMVVGNGYVPGHAECALQSIQSHEGIKDYFLKTYC